MSVIGKYQPFDQNFTFQVNGQFRRYVKTPLDEAYETEPGDLYAKGSLPPEEYSNGSLPPQECELRDLILIVSFDAKRMSAFDFYWSRFFWSTSAHKEYEKNLNYLKSVANSSPEHRAACIRISKDSSVGKSLAITLRQLVRQSKKF